MEPNWRAVAATAGGSKEFDVALAPEVQTWGDLEVYGEIENHGVPQGPRSQT